MTLLAEGVKRADIGVRRVLVKGKDEGKGGEGSL